MAGRTLRRITVTIDQEAMKRLKDQGEIRVEHPSDHMDCIDIQYVDENLEPEPKQTEPKGEGYY